MRHKAFSSKYSRDQIFENEVKSYNNLKKLLDTRVGFNTHKDPWNKEIVQINPETKFPEWVKKIENGKEELNFYDDYECIEKLIILSQRNKYFDSKYNNQFEKAYIGGGHMINLQHRIQYQINNTQKQRQMIVLKDSQAKRPSASKRFQALPFQFQTQEDHLDFNIVQNNQSKKQLRQNLGNEFFEQNGCKEPSIKQIFDGLMIEMALQLKSSNLEETEEQVLLAIENHSQAWKFIFECFGLDAYNTEEIDKPIFWQPENKITKSILFIYSMETFLPYNLNQAERNKDIQKVQSFGPFAYALKQITSFAQSEKRKFLIFSDNLNPSCYLYRGTKFSPEMLNLYRQKLENNEQIVLDGYTSTSEIKDTALEFMHKDKKNDDISVLYQISGLNEDGYRYFRLDTKEYSNFPNEKEVLLRTGQKFQILQISQEKHDDWGEYYQIELKYLNDE